MTEEPTRKLKKKLFQILKKEIHPLKIIEFYLN